MGNLFMIKGKIVLVPFPFDDLSATKVRPAVCLTKPVGIHKHIILAFISSNTSIKLEETDLLIDKNHPDFKKTGLKAASIFRLHRVMTVSLSFIKRELGEITGEIKKEINSRLRKLFEL